MAVDIGVWGGLSSSIVPHVCPCQYHTALIIMFVWGSEIRKYESSYNLLQVNSNSI